ncbi:MAG: hypothetical protein GX811_07485, partial [Lentisphaerae bacterium]|nr:hypothetical protein [Lentisphaerota bacterium]
MRVPKSSIQNILFFFIDGLGIGLDDPSVNPCANHKLKWFRNFSTDTFPKQIHNTGFAVPLDATLGIPGLPQSGTGQTSIFTGINAPKIEGAHKGPYPTVQLRKIIASNSIYKRLAVFGVKSQFFNAYTKKYFNTDIETLIPTLTVTSLASYYSNIPFLSI